MTQTATADTPLIFGRIAALMADTPAIAKSQKNKEQGYQFRGIDTIYNNLHDLMVKHGIFTTSEILETQRNEWLSKSGGKLIEFALRIRWTFWAIDGSHVHSETMGQAMDTADKAANKAMTMSHKTALLQIFMIPTAETPDPDANTPDPQERYNHSNGHSTSLPPMPTPPMTPGYQPPPQQQAQQQQRAPQGGQNNGYSSGNGGRASGKQVEYLTDLVKREGFSDHDRQYVDWLIQQGMSREQCSGLIDRANAHLGGSLNAPFVPQSQAAGEEKDDLPF
ncbi:MAG: hypothetical protein HGB21_13085 [Nitrospirae bacterium]|nr:hypothetical protein [Nitrospirota bacterium]